MQMNDMILVSVDDHVVEPPDLFDQHIPAQYRDRAPKLVQNKRGDDVWTWEGRTMPNIGLNAVAGRVPAEYGMEPTSYSQMRKGCHAISLSENPVSMGLPSYHDDEFWEPVWKACVDEGTAIPREQCTVGALRSQATDVDLTPIQGVGGKPPGQDEGAVVRMAQVAKQLAGAFDG